jgi:hypothetical protein
VAEAKKTEAVKVEVLGFDSDINRPLLGPAPPRAMADYRFAAPAPAGRHSLPIDDARALGDAASRRRWS